LRDEAIEETKPLDSSSMELKTTSQQSEPSLDDIMYRVKSFIAKNRIRIREFLQDYDPLRNGVIHPHKFRSGLSSAGIKLTEPELAVLEKQYTVPTLGFNHTSLNYVAFCDEIDQGKSQIFNSNCFSVFGFKVGKNSFETNSTI
jgi:hypothetical protein